MALEEQIGDVKTGLTEEFIIKNLKTSVHSSQATTLPSDALSRFSPEAEACIVCQVFHVICRLHSLATNFFCLLFMFREGHILLIILIIRSFQVEYEEDEIIGTLDCGHNYHGECIKQWLLVKNLCPICKKTGLATINSEG